MLTKDLIKYRISKDGAVKPGFIDTKNETLLHIAQQLIALYDAHGGSRRSNLEEVAVGITNGAKDTKRARGFNKLMLDRCTFSQQTQDDYRAQRTRVLEQSTVLLSQGLSFEDFHEKIQENCADISHCLTDLYADHPDNETLIACKSITPEKFLEEYNRSLVQGLLLNSKQLVAEIHCSDPAQIRAVLRVLRFHRLLAEITENSTKGILTLTINGPGSMFENVNKYGLQLAIFFPVLCSFHRWSIHTTLTLNNRPVTLELDEKSKLVGKAPNTYYPDDFRIFAERFTQKVPDWKINDKMQILHGEKGEYILPDFCFVHKASGKKVYMELFHRWHAGLLIRRIPFLFTRDDFIIGIDRAVLTQRAVKEALEASSLPTDRFFEFRDFPAYSSVKRVLNAQNETSAQNMYFIDDLM